jgi:hypothetical protein
VSIKPSTALIASHAATPNSSKRHAQVPLARRRIHRGAERRLAEQKRAVRQFSKSRIN